MNIFSGTATTAAIHEAGHVIALIRGNHKFSYVTIKPAANDQYDTYGHVAVPAPVAASPRVLLAGMAAEAVNLGRKRTIPFWVYVANASDRDKLGPFERALSAKDMQNIERMTVQFIRDEWHNVLRIADELVARETLTYADVHRVLRDGHQ